MILKRKIYDKLINWKNTNGKTALLIKGARRIGKSFIAELFAKNEYKSYIKIDFSDVDKIIIDLFNNNSSNRDYFFSALSNYYGVELFNRNTLFIFDEIQLFPKARQLIKHLVADGRYDYIETGSLLSINNNVKDILIPSEEHSVEMYPLDFIEYLYANKREDLIEYISNCFTKKIPLGQVSHKLVMRYFREYLIVGGMPQAILEYLETKNFTEVENIKKQIIETYKNDITKFAKNYSSKVKSIFDNIPSELSKKEKRFKLSVLKNKATFKSYENSFLWLSDSMITNICFSSTDPNIGLKLNLDRLTLKCYMADTGLLLTLFINDNDNIKIDTIKSLLFSKLSINEGMLMENVVSQLLKSSGHKLFFYSSSDRNDSKNRMEIDFLIAEDKYISPIEVKSSEYKSHKSIDKFYLKYKERINNRYIIYTKDLKIEDKVIYLPVYMTSFL
jgi:predicted AAA+ superfamily ATPase